MLSFGIVNGNELSYTDSSRVSTSSPRRSRGSVWDWTCKLSNTGPGSYNLSVTNLGGGYATTTSGTLEASAPPVFDSFAVINSSTGGNQNVIFDVPTVTAAPEPSTLALIGMSAIGSMCYFRHRK